jgi:hypothetical protein
MSLTPLAGDYALMTTRPMGFQTNSARIAFGGVAVVRNVAALFMVIYSQQTDMNWPRSISKNDRYRMHFVSQETLAQPCIQRVSRRRRARVADGPPG